MTQNRKYTQITFDQVLNDLLKILRAKEGALADTGEASFGRTMLELFAGNTDLMASFGESVFQNAYLETATKLESIYLGARSLGYSIRRPVPAKAGLGIQLKRTGVYPTVKVNIAKGTKFALSSLLLTAVDDMEFSYDRTNSDYTNGLMELVSGRAVLAEGAFLTTNFFSTGKQNQEFIITDPNFSDYFGFGDPNWVEPDKFSQRSTRFTTVTSDASLMDNFNPEFAIDDLVYWRISRRGFQDPSTSNTVNDIDNFVNGDNKTTNYSVIIDTANDGNARLQFGDGIKSAIPYGKIALTYFATNGERGNVMNVAGTAITATPGSILITQEDGTESDLSLADLNIALTTDVRGGLNIESAESIKKNAPQLFNSLDSLNNKSSYKTYLRRYADIKYANAFGEDILNEKMSSTHDVDYGKRINRNIKYSNIVRFSVLKDLYRAKDDSYYPTESVEYYLDGYKVNGLVYLWQYDYQELPPTNLFTNFGANLDKIQATMNDDLVNDNISISMTNSDGSITTLTNDSSEFFKKYFGTITYSLPMIPKFVYSANLTPLDFAEDGSELESLLQSLNRKGYITLGGGQHMYVPPIVHDFTIKMDITLFRGYTFNDIKTNIRNKIYAYLKEYTEFATPIFRSKLETLIHSFPEVAGVNITLVPKENSYSSLDLTTLTWMSDDISQFINQRDISYDAFDIKLYYDYKYKDISGTTNSAYNKSVTFEIDTQESVRGAILNYYKSYLSYYDSSLGTYVPKNDLTEEKLNKFTAFIWSAMINKVYEPMFSLYKLHKNNGNVLEANAIFNLIEAIKGWYENSGALAFKETDAIVNLTEGTSSTLYNYFKYTIEYIKLVRNILATTIASKLIDEDGNITQYTNENEIVQFNISSEDIELSVESDSLLSRK